MSNPYFNPDECPFEILGFYEEFLEPETGRMIGQVNIKEPNRKLGSDGRRHVILTETCWMKKGRKMVVVKASVKKPIHAVAMIQIICGRLKSNLKAEKEGTFYPTKPLRS